MRSIYALMIGVLLVFGQSLYAEESTTLPSPISALEQLKMDIEEIRQNTMTPAVGIALVDKNGPYWVAGLGQADVERDIPADENTMFRIGSISKMFVALAALKLVEEGRLDLDARLRDLAPEIEYDNPWESMNPVRLVHLLEHTSGWDDMHPAERAYPNAKGIDLESALAIHPDSRTSRWVPGTRTAYCNTGPAVVAYVIEKIVGQEFEEYVQNELFNPLGMATSTYFDTEDYVQHAATLYSNGKPQDYWHIPYRPVGSINASVSDMANFVHFLLQRGQFNNQRLLREASFDRMETPKTNLGAKNGVLGGYALHNYTSGFQDYGVAFRGHSGGIVGALAELAYAPELGQGYIIMLNNAGPARSQIAEKIREYLLRQKQKNSKNSLPLPEKFKQIGGLYKVVNPRFEQGRLLSDFLGILKVSAQGDTFHREPLFGGWKSTDYAISENLLVNPWSGLPEITIADDPLVGEVLVVESATYKKVSVIRVVGSLILIISVLCLSLASIVYAFVWITRRVTGKIEGGAGIQVRLWPTLSSLVLLIFLICNIYVVENIFSIGVVSFATVALFLLSISYAILSACGPLVVFVYRSAPISKPVYWLAIILSVLHALNALYLASYGFIGLKIWA